MPVFRAE